MTTQTPSDLFTSMPVAMRHPTLREVVTFYAERTGLHAIVPDRPYATTRIPYFGGLGSGFHGVASLGEVFGIPDYTWGAQGDGRLFVGSWADSRWPSRPVELPRELFIRSASTGSRVVAVPGLRPGAVLNGERIHALRLAGHEMEITCKRP